MDLISVIVPVYKVEQYLDECIQSIVNQTYTNLEIILVDDGSPDNCPRICDEWAKKDSRIRVIHQKNRGLSAARNAGIDISVGDYIGFVDSDDYIAADMYELLISTLQQTTVKMAGCAIARVYNTKSIVYEKKYISKNTIMTTKEAIDASFKKKICNAVWCKLYRKCVFDEVRFPVGEVNEDYPVMIPIIIKSSGMAFVNKTMYYYRKRQDSITSTGYMNFDNAKLMYKNLLLIERQLDENSVKSGCVRGYSFFVARNAYSMALTMEKNKANLDHDLFDLLKKYKRMMKSNCIIYLFSMYSSIKDKILYFMVLTGMLNPVYKFLRKKK